MLLLLAFGCLINGDLYERRLAELLDGDQDGYESTAEGGDDCDDADDAVHPGAAEVAYDAVDQDCDGVDLTDVDGDGAEGGAVGTDCDDEDGTVHPGAEEVAYDGVDQDCAGGDLVDVDGDGSDAIEVGGADCDDTDAFVGPGMAETWANGFRDNDCDGDADPASTRFGSVTWYGPMAGAAAGAHLQPLEDLDGDGRAEWAVGAYFDSSHAAYGGAVYVASGSEGGDLAGQHAVYGGENWFLGTSLGRTADVDGDGLAELLIGATGMESGAGGAFLVTSTELAGSGESELPAAARLTLVGATPDTYAGASVAGLGDLDGDGIGEIAVSCPYLTVDGYTQAGRVYVLPADTAGTASLADSAWTWDGYFVDGALGNHVLPAGDQDGDGYDDVLVTMENGVAAWIAPGGGAGGSIEDVASVAVFNPEARPISAVEIIGDVDGDGTRDLLIAHDYLALHIDLTGSPSRLIDEGASTFVDTGGSVIASAAEVGDRDGDGLAETLLGSPLFLDEGTGWIGIVPATFWLEESASLADLPLTATSVRPAAAGGSSVALADDTDGDGQADILIGASSDDEGGENAGGVAVLPAPE